MCLLSFCPILFSRFFISAFPLSFFHPLPLSTSYLRFFYPPRSGTHC